MTCPRRQWRCVAIMALTVYSPPASVSPAFANTRYIEFDVPGAIGTYPASIDGENNVAGSYLDSNSRHHGFVRTASGAILTFDPIGSRLTSVAAINAGTVVGSFQMRNNLYRGFVRTFDGVITRFNVPGALETLAVAISGNGATAGYFYTSSASDGFVRSPSGKFTTFHVPDAILTQPVGINGTGNTAGRWLDNAKATHGFLRTADGNLTEFDPPSSINTYPTAIDNSGTIVGNYDDYHGRTHGFVRNPDGKFITRALTAGGPTYPTDLARRRGRGSDITGYVLSRTRYGFIRFANGKLVTFEAPDAGTGPYEGTFSQSINPNDFVAGTYVDQSGATHGFIRTH